MSRSDGRKADELRPVSAIRGYGEYAEGSVLYQAGKTRVFITASVADGVPDFLRGSGKGWVTAEYSMLPRSTDVRTSREVNRGRPGGRTQEIQRLIGRSLRAVVDFKKLGENTIWLDCDVLQADGGTRTAAITGAYMALSDACSSMVSEEKIPESPLLDEVAAVSVGVIGDSELLDLCYEEDSAADVDFNVVMSGSGKFIELQGTAEGEPFDRRRLDGLIDLAAKGIGELVSIQKDLLATPPAK